MTVIRRFFSDEQGGLTPFILVFFIGIVLLTGIALDLARFESERADLQDALDRGVLAAASATQSLPAATVLSEFIANRSMSEGLVNLNVLDTSSAGTRRVTADADYALDTIFLRLAGLSELGVISRSAAEQRRQHVEISLVLDISGTMRWSNRLVNLRPAASQFIDTVMANDTQGLTTVNLIPYAGQVNPGPAMFNILGGIRDHNYSSCLEFNSSDFGYTGLPAAGSYGQVPNFMHWTIDWGWMDWGWCPTDNTAITYFSNDAALLKNKINAIRLHDGTGTYNAMKWALALLDPSTQSTSAQLASLGVIDPAYADRPAAWNAPESLKFIVLMTDGQITQQYRPNDPFDPRLATKEEKPYNIPYSQTYSRTSGLNSFYGLCDLARNNGVTVFTIAFEAPASAQTEMQNCASSLGHYYDVQGLQISVVFQQIAATIQKLKLVE